MNYVEYLKVSDNFSKYIVFLSELGFSDIEIASMLGYSRQYVHTTRKNYMVSLKLAIDKP